MKRIIIVFLALVLAVPLLAQEGDEANDGFKTGFKYTLEAGGGITEGESPALDINVINSYQFSPHLSVGLGLGLLYLHKYDLYPMFLDRRSLPSIPVFIDISITALDRGISPFISVRAGYALNLKKDYSRYVTGTTYYYDYQGGYIINPLLGIKFSLASGKFLNVGAGYVLKKINIESSSTYTYPDGYIKDHGSNEHIFNCQIFSLNLSLSF